MKTIITLLVLVTLAAVVADAHEQQRQLGFFTRRLRNVVELASANENPEVSPIPNVFFSMAKYGRVRNATATTNLFAENATFKICQASNCATYYGKSQISNYFINGFNATPLILLSSMNIAFARHSQPLGICDMTVTMVPTGSPSVVIFDNIYIKLDSNNHIVSYDELMENPGQANESAMLAFIDRFASNIITRHNPSELRESLTPGMVLIVSHDYPSETEVIPGAFFSSFIEDDWKDASAVTGKLTKAWVSGSFVMLQLTYVFTFSKPEVSSMAKSFSFRAQLTAGGPLGFQISELAGIELNVYTNE
jgi:hypothetical protein